MTNTHINVGGHKITTNKVGAKHDLSSVLETGFSVSLSASYKVVNRICFVELWGLQGTTTGAHKLIASGNFPKPGASFRVVDGDGSGLAMIVYNNYSYNQNADMYANVIRANTGAYLAFSYPVADDWSE